MTTPSAPDPTITIKTRSGRVLDLPAIEETIHNGLVRREPAGRLAKRKLSAAFKH
ncbi:hypothetical protein SLS55_006344 [Diplodia seriata]|uniref:Uncharacterized protein n=1 Tax=Diplodia seriata TaxID=420778 RepID=A0ABR3CF76_9PEZI